MSISPDPPNTDKDPKRKKPYVWVSWITGLLSGEDKCWWSPWYRAHHMHEKMPESDDRAQFLSDWTAKHDEMVQKRAEIMRAAGYTVRVEDDGAFKLDGKTVTLSGKTDVVGLRGEEARIIDQKSGKERDKDKWQVRIYMWALPLTWLVGKHEVTGEVEYKGGKLVPVQLRPGDTEQIVGVMQKMGSQVPPPKVPSRYECQYCSIKKCDKRYQENPTGQPVLEF